MSAILAIKHEGHVWMAADSAVSSDAKICDCINLPKIIQRGKLTFGIGGDAKAIKLIEHVYNVPTRKKNQTADNYIYNTIWNTLGAFLINNKCISASENNEITFNVLMIIAYEHRIFETDSCFGFAEMRKHCAVGVSPDYCDALLGLIEEDEKDIRGALENIMQKVIQKYNYVREPIDIRKV